MIICINLLYSITMRTLSLTLFIVPWMCLALPQVSQADNLTSGDPELSTDFTPQIVSHGTSAALALYQTGGGKLVVQTWTKTDGWSDVTTIFSDSDDEYDYIGNVFLTTGYTVMAVSDGVSVQLISYNTSDGLVVSEVPYDMQYFYNGGTVAVLASFERITVSSHNSAYDHNLYLSTWSPTAGFTDQVTTTLKISSSNQTTALVVSETGLVVLRYTSDNSYVQVFDALNNFSSSTAETIPDIPEGKTVSLISSDDVIFTPNGEVVWLANVGSDDSLLAYRSADGVWAEPMIVSDGRVETVMQTSDAAQIGAVLTKNPDNQTTFYFYSWTASDGWTTTLTKSINDPTTIITPGVVRKDDALYVGLSTSTTDKLRILRKTSDSKWKQVSKTSLGCSSSCTKTLDVSKKGKVFLSWIVDQETYNGKVWDPAKKKWEAKRQLNGTDATVKGSRIYQHVTPKGNYVVTWYERVENNTNDIYRTYSARWVPNSGWQSTKLIAEATIEDMVQDGNTIYAVGSDSETDSIRLSKIGIREQDEVESYDELKSYLTALSVGETLLTVYQNKDRDLIIEDYAL